MIGADRGESCNAAGVISRAGSNNARTENGEVNKQTRPPFDPAAHTLSAAPQEALTFAARVYLFFCHLEGPRSSFAIWIADLAHRYGTASGSDRPAVWLPTSTNKGRSLPLAVP